MIDDVIKRLAVPTGTGADAPDIPRPRLGAEAFVGLAGDIVTSLDAFTEADPAAVLIQLLAGFGNLVGRNPHWVAGADRHGMNLMVVVVGETAKARKGSSWSLTKRVLGLADPDWERRCLKSGLSSGEGLIWHVRDALPGELQEDGQVAGAQPGVDDKRLLVVEPEFSSVLKMTKRDSNILSDVIRQAWDDGTLATLTKNSPVTATETHISIIAHITKTELRRRLGDTEQANGFINRFLLVSAFRSKLIDDPQMPPEAMVFAITQRLRAAAEYARGVGALTLDPEARAAWREIYADVSAGHPGVVGAMLARAEAQIRRIACIYALMDQSSVVRAPHLFAGLGVWRYVEDSTRYIFGQLAGLGLAEKIFTTMKNSPAGLTKTQIHNALNRNVDKEELDHALAVLRERRLAVVEVERIGGKRPVERWFVSLEENSSNSLNSSDKPSNQGSRTVDGGESESQH